MWHRLDMYYEHVSRKKNHMELDILRSESGLHPYVEINLIWAGYLWERTDGVFSVIRLTHHLKCDSAAVKWVKHVQRTLCAFCWKHHQNSRSAAEGSGDRKRSSLKPSSFSALLPHSSLHVWLRCWPLGVWMFTKISKLYTMAILPCSQLTVLKISGSGSQLRYITTSGCCRYSNSSLLLPLLIPVIRAIQWAL